MSKIIDAIFPIISNRKSNAVLRKKLHPQNESGEYIAPSGILCDIEDADKISLDLLKEEYSDTYRVKDNLEDKAKTNIIGATISITLIMGASGILSVVNEKFQSPLFAWIAFSLFVVSVAYMLIAGLLVIRVLISENEVYVVRLNSIAAGGQTLRDDYDKCIAQNRRQNLVRNNNIYTSYECIRNALICLFIILVLVAVPFSASPSQNDMSHIYSSQNYTFEFSLFTIDFIKENEVRNSVEDTIVSTIDSLETTNEGETYGIIDSHNKLFIKFMIYDNHITVFLIEPYIT